MGLEEGRVKDTYSQTEAETLTRGGWDQCDTTADSEKEEGPLEDRGDRSGFGHKGDKRTLEEIEDKEEGKQRRKSN